MMKKGLLILGFVFILASMGLSTAGAVKMGIVTGGKKGTYYQFGLNLKELVNRHGFQLRVDNSTGSIENLYAVYRRPRTQLGIVQSDVLAFVARMENEPILRQIARKTKMVFPLYNEEIHLLGRKDVNSFDQLAGKRVAIGKEGSGTYLTAKLLFEVSNVRPQKMVSIGTDDALSQLKAGSIDAMFYVAGLPVKLFREDVTAADGLALSPITNKSIMEFYPRAEIPANIYNWQVESVNTVAVKAVLVSFNFRRANCEYVGDVAQILYENMEWLIQNGHPKWNIVDLNYPLKGWEQYDCVKKYLTRSKTATLPVASGINPILQAVKEILGP